MVCHNGLNSSKNTSVLGKKKIEGLFLKTWGIGIIWLRWPPFVFHGRKKIKRVCIIGGDKLMKKWNSLSMLSKSTKY